MPKQATADDALLGKINELFRSLADLVREQIKLKNDFEAENQKRKTTYDADNTALEAKIKQVKVELRGLIIANRTKLLSGDLKSFVTEFARFSFRTVHGKFKVTNPNGATVMAGKRGIKRKVCSIKVVYKLEPDKLKAHLDGHPEDVPYFDEFIDRGASWESLSVKPNDTYHTRHDTSRLTAKPISLNDDADDTSPDA